MSRTKSHLKRHENDKHTRERTFQCPEPGCTYAATQRSNLAPHLRTHNRNQTPALPADMEKYVQDLGQYHPQHPHPNYGYTNVTGTSMTPELTTLLSAQADLLNQYTSLLPTVNPDDPFKQVPAEPTFRMLANQELLNVTPTAIPPPFGHSHYPINTSDHSTGHNIGYTMTAGSELHSPLSSTGPNDPWNAPLSIPTSRVDRPGSSQDIPYRSWVEYLGVVPSRSMGYGNPLSTVTRRMS